MNLAGEASRVTVPRTRWWNASRGGSLFVPPADRVRAALTDMGLDRSHTGRTRSACRARCSMHFDRVHHIFDPYPPFVVGLEGVLAERRGKQASPLDPVRTDASPVSPGHNQPQLFKHSVPGVSSMPKMLTPPQTPKPGHEVEWDMTPRCVKWIRTSATPWIGCWRLWWPRNRTRACKWGPVGPGRIRDANLRRTTAGGGLRGHVWMFRCPAGQEEALRTAVADLALRGDLDPLAASVVEDPSPPKSRRTTATPDRTTC